MRKGAQAFILLVRGLEYPPVPVTPSPLAGVRDRTVYTDARDRDVFTDARDRTVYTDARSRDIYV